LSKTIRTDPCGVLNINELKPENVLFRTSYYALPVSHLKWQTVLDTEKRQSHDPSLERILQFITFITACVSLLFELG
jgi:hypothetical protein